MPGLPGLEGGAFVIALALISVNVGNENERRSPGPPGLSLELADVSLIYLDEVIVVCMIQERADSGNKSSREGAACLQ